MNSDLISIIINVSRSFDAFQKLIAGLAYLLGILFVIKALHLFRKIANKHGHSSSESMFVPIAYLLAGSVMFFLPSAISMASNTLFGLSNILQYGAYDPYDFSKAVYVIIRTAGLIWFVRGSVLLAHASEPGGKDGPRGLLFLFAGILAMNFEQTLGYLSWLLEQITTSNLNFSIL